MLNLAIPDSVDPLRARERNFEQLARGGYA